MLALWRLAPAAADPSRRGCRYPFKPDQIIQNTDWELYIAQIAREIMSEQSPKALFQARVPASGATHARTEL